MVIITACVDLTNEKFGRLTVIKRVENNPCGRSQWLCECECGNQLVVLGNSLTRGSTKSCGCYRRENTGKLNRTHGSTGTRLYRIWKAMKGRCYNPNYHEYEFYGGKGITICDQWLNDFKSFEQWSMKNGYDNKLTIDRIDNNSNYSPENCQWVTRSFNTTKRNLNYWSNVGVVR